MKTSSYRFSLALMVGALVLSACSEDAEVEVTADDIADIEQALAEGSALHWELTRAESRVAAHCMEDQGFTVHDPLRLHGNMIPHRFDGFSSPYDDLPTVEQAKKFGFGLWLYTAGGEAIETLRADPDYQEFRGDEDGWWDPSSDARHEEWKAMDQEYRDAWEEAFVGSERLEHERAVSEAIESGEYDAEQDIDEPPFGGCELTTIEVVYGEPVKMESESGDWWMKPDLESPMTWIGDGAIYNELSADFWEQENDFLDCLDESGYGTWEFDEFGALPLEDYFAQIDASLPRSVPMPENLPEPPSNLSGGPDELKAYEIATAVDFAECADAADLREEAEEAWARLNVEQLIDREAEVYAWQEEVEGYLTNAQDYLSA